MIAEPWLTVRQVAEHYNCSIDVIYADLKAGRIKGMKIRKDGGKQWTWYVDKDSLPANRRWTCASCNKPIGAGNSMVLTNISTTPGGRREVKGTEGRYCSDVCLAKRWDGFDTAVQHAGILQRILREFQGRKNG